MWPITNVVVNLPAMDPFSIKLFSSFLQFLPETFNFLIFNFIATFSPINLEVHHFESAEWLNESARGVIVLMMKEWDEIINRSGVICTYKVWECSWFMLDAWGMIKRESTDRKNYICSEHIIVVDMQYFQGRCIWGLADSLGTECNLIYIIVEWNESCLCCVSLNGCRHFLPNITTFS